MFKNTLFLVFLFSFSILSSMNCTSSCGNDGHRRLSVSWDPPHAREMVNVAGGGHRIYYTSQKGTVSTSSNKVDVPMSQSSTGGMISGLSSGCTYYVRVQAYSALNPAGGVLSDEFSIQVP